MNDGSAAKTNGSSQPGIKITQQHYAQQFATAKALFQQHRLEEAETLLLTLLQQGAATSEMFNMLGGIALTAGRCEDAVVRLKQAIIAEPRNADHHYNLGLALQQLGNAEEAVQSYNRAIILKPDYLDANLKAAWILQKAGKSEQAIPFVIRLCKAEPENRSHWFFYVHITQGLPLYEQEKELREPLKIALRQELNAAVRTSVLRMVSCNDWYVELDALFLQGEYESMEKKLGDPEFLQKMQDPMLLNLMARSHIPTPVMDLIFNLLRRQLLLKSGLAEREDIRPLVIALWRLCFVNEYVFLAEEDEIAALVPLRTEIGNALDKGEAPDIVSLALLGSYVPLVEEDFADDLMKWKTDDKILAAILQEQISQPLEERKRAAAIPMLVEITDETTQQVRAQYEKNPYPRWRELPENTPCSVEEYLQNTLVQQCWEALPESTSDVLIAGCGTGQHAIEVAMQLPKCKVLAVDISLASLSYAQRKVEETGADNIKLLQADILDLGKLERSFDVIESVGVLHHMRDPMAGWKVLTDLLRPGGVMKIGLYSQTARRAISLARKEIEEQGVGADDDAIRRYRRSLIMRSANDNAAAFSPDAVTLKEVFYASDFYAMSECRDLLFHVQEHQFTLPQIEADIKKLGLEFLGMHRMDETKHGMFHYTLPEKDRSSDFDRWHEYEREHPDTFRSMYRFWIQKPR